MNSLFTLFTSLLVATWVGAIAILAVQNFTPISLRFLAFQSIQIPVGLVLAFSVGLGLVGAAIAQPLLSASGGETDED